KAGSQSPSIDVDADSPAVLHYTSGSSGRLKAAVQTFGNRMSLIRKTLMTPDRSLEQQTLAHVGPVTHASGMQIMPTLFTGGCNYHLEKFDEELLLDTIEKQQITRLFAVPTMIYRLLERAGNTSHDLSSLQRITYGASPMAPARLRE